MTLTELKKLLDDHSDLQFRISLPDGLPIPQSFHVTEVGRVQKTFLDCGGKLRNSITCQLQVWIGPDHDHRLETRKMASILKKAAVYLPDESVPVEVEYENRLISQYSIAGHEVTREAVILRLVYKHTECLAPELCGLPPIDRLPPPGQPRCSPSGCC